MKKCIIFISLFYLTYQFNVPNVYSQTYTTSTKNCGKCGKQVSASAKVGDRCPHCGVVWGRENSHSTTTTIPSVYPNSSYPITSSNPKSQSTTNATKVEVDDSRATKSETEEWVLEKFRKYTPSRYYYNTSIVGMPSFGSGTYLKNFAFYFDEHNFIIEYEEEYSNRTEKLKQIVPIYDILEIYDYIEKIVFTTRSETMTDFNVTDNKRKTEDYFSMKFEIKAETELCNRIHKAFLHLKKFYKRPASNEPF